MLRNIIQSWAEIWHFALLIPDIGKGKSIRQAKQKHLILFKRQLWRMFSKYIGCFFVLRQLEVAQFWRERKHLDVFLPVRSPVCTFFHVYVRTLVRISPPTAQFRFESSIHTWKTWVYNRELKKKDFHFEKMTWL